MGFNSFARQGLINHNLNNYQIVQVEWMNNTPLDKTLDTVFFQQIAVWCYFSVPVLSTNIPNLWFKRFLKKAESHIDVFLIYWCNNFPSTISNPISMCIERGWSHPTWLQTKAGAISSADLALNCTDTEVVSSLDDPGVMVDGSGGCAGAALILSLAMRWLLLLCTGTGFHPNS